MELVLASGNAHKAQEFDELFTLDFLKVKPAREKLEVAETGESFQENALLKAEAYFALEKSPVVADDSGLVVQYLPDELGIHSARFGGPDLSDAERAYLLLERLSGLTRSEERAAYFVCHLCLYFSADEIYFFEGRLNGTISRDYRGEAGFGYDPVFIPDGLSEQTLAENPEWKSQNSHRAIAVGYAERFLKERRGQRA